MAVKHTDPQLCSNCDEVETLRGYYADGRWLPHCETCEPDPCSCCDGPDRDLCDGCPSEEDCQGKPLCHRCDGSGEGMADGSTCYHCRGQGVEPRRDEDEPIDED